MSKKTAKKKDIIADKKTEEQTVNANKANFVYAGKVSVKVVDGKRIISKQTSHNAGTARLFNFFYNCLAGNFSTAGNLRPNKIMIFESAKDEKTEFDETAQQLSQFIAENSAAAINSEKNAVTFHFLIPFAKIISAGDTTKINQIAIYASSISDYKSPSAWYRLETPIELTKDTSASLNLVVEWKMSIDNKN